MRVVSIVYALSLISCWQRVHADRLRQFQGFNAGVSAFSNDLSPLRRPGTCACAALPCSDVLAARSLLLTVRVCPHPRRCAL